MNKVEVTCTCCEETIVMENMPSVLTCPMCFTEYKMVVTEMSPEDGLVICYERIGE